MLFTERHHAFISATFYRLLKEGNYKNYRRAFICATQKMAEQRGARMAQRAIRDGIEELDYEAYRHYGEWNWSEAYLESIKNKKHIDEIHSDTDYGYAVYECPWADVYHEEGIAQDGGVDYCFDLDPSLVRGFNPELKYKTTQTLQTCDTCIQFQVNGKINKNHALGPGKLENTKGFDYHCGHVYQAYFDYMIAIYGVEGLFLGAKVLECFSKKYGKEMADVIVKHLKTDFNYI